MVGSRRLELPSSVSTKQLLHNDYAALSLKLIPLNQSDNGNGTDRETGWRQLAKRHRILFLSHGSDRRAVFFQLARVFHRACALLDLAQRGNRDGLPSPSNAPVVQGAEGR